MISRESTLERLATASSVMLDRTGLTETTIARALGTIAQRDVDDADLYFQTTRQEAWVLEDGIVKEGSFKISQGVGVRAVVGDKTAFAHSDDLSERSLLEAARTVRTIAGAGQDRRVRIRHARRLAEGRILYGATDPISGSDSAAKVALLDRVEKLAKARDPRVVQVMASIGLNHEVILVARADGMRAADVRPMVRLILKVIVMQDGRAEIGASGGGGRHSLDYFDEAMLRGYVDSAVGIALTNLDSRPAPSGEMTVVLGPGGPGVMLHEAVGHGLEADFNRKGTSVFAGRIGDRVAARGVTILDDGTLPGARGSLNMDDEGNLSQRNTLVEDGVLRGYMQDRQNARLMRAAPTGNCRRESYAHLPAPRMTNTFMLAGELSREEIVSSIRRGLYAVNFGSGQVDITSGQFVFSASEAYWVENGRILYPVKGATIVGDGADALTRITMVGDDLELDPGVSVCGKEGQRIPVTVGQPTLRIEGLTVGGTA